MEKEALEVAFDRGADVVRKRSSPVPSGLLHFTNAAGLLGILEKKSIWLGRARSLNDSREIDHGLTIATSAIDEAIERTTDPREEAYLPQARKIVTSGTMELEDEGFPFTDPHVACLCEADDRDSLLHWGMYGNAGDGFAIRFAMDAIPHNKKGGPDLWKVEYDEKSQKEEMSRALEKVMRAARTAKGFRELADQNLSTGYVGSIAGYALVQLAAAMKARNFAPEREWRFVVSYAPPPAVTDWDLKLEFRAVGSTIKPYYVLPIAADAIREIILGPKINRQLNEPALRMLLRERGYAGVRVTRSALSLR